MLTADLVVVRRRGSELRVPPSDEARRAKVAALAESFQAAARARLGAPREEVDSALADALERVLAGAGWGPADRRLAAGVLKLVRDGFRFEEPDGEAAQALRREVFRRAARARRARDPLRGSFEEDRAVLLGTIATERGSTADAIEAALFSDRPAAQRLLAVEGPPPAAIAAAFEVSEAQAVLLRATKVNAQIRARDPGFYRQLFRQLKFLRLLPVIHRAARPEDGYLVELDGPFSLFQGQGRYGLQLALALSAISAADAWTIDAEVRWGADRRPLRFRCSGGATAALPAAPLPDELARFVAGFERLESGWRVDQTPAILELPGAGLCVPDFAFVRSADGATVHFELLGFWSREAVWRRVDLVRAGFAHRILFAASRTLRVGEGVLEDAPQAALYVYTRVLEPRQVLRRIEVLAGDPSPGPQTGTAAPAPRP